MSHGIISCKFLVGLVAIEEMKNPLLAKPHRVGKVFSFESHVQIVLINLQDLLDRFLEPKTFITTPLLYGVLLLLNSNTIFSLHLWESPLTTTFRKKRFLAFTMNCPIFDCHFQL